MVTNIFVTVLNMSITAACIVLALLLVRPLLTRLPRVFGYMLWSVVLLRLLCPVSVTGVFSLLGVLGGSSTVSESVVILEQPIATGLASSMQWAAPQLVASNPTFDVLAVAWASGAVVMLLLYTYELLRLRRRVAGAVRVGGRVYKCSSIDSPFVFGLLRPAIYLPYEMQDHDMQLILKHEQTHIKRLDHVVKLVAFTALCLHWFNPLVWLSVVLLSRDMEISCDEQVIARLDTKERHSYGLLLLELAAGNRATVGAISFGQNDVTRRIKNVLNFKNLPRRFWWVAGGLSAVLLVVLVTNPAAEPVPPVPAGTPASQLQVRVTEIDTPNDATAVFVAATADQLEKDTGISVTTTDTEPQEISFVWPLVDKGYVSMGLDGYRGHTGVDIAAPHGTEIVAAQDGYVEFAINQVDSGPYGKHIIIYHGDNYRTRYAHCSEILVEAGQEVKQGQIIAKVGQTGNANNIHCHFEIIYYKDGLVNEEHPEENYLNPKDYIGSKPPEKEEDAS